MSRDKQIYAIFSALPVLLAATYVLFRWLHYADMRALLTKPGAYPGDSAELAEHWLDFVFAAIVGSVFIFIATLALMVIVGIVIDQLSFRVRASRESSAREVKQ